jgi:outer membrane protein TolC
LVIGILSNIWSSAQNIENSNTKVVSDSLTLKTVMDSVFNNNPMLKELTENINGSKFKIDLAKTSYLPNVEASASYSRMDPNPKISIPNMGSFQLYPDNSFDAHVGVNQLIYDFGKTKSNIEMLQSGKELTEMSVEQGKQKLSNIVAVYFYNLFYLQEAEKIKTEQLTTLKQHLDFVEKKLETGSAVKYEIISTKVKISGVENQLTEIENNKELQISHLSILLGKPDFSFAVKAELNPDYVLLPVDSLYNNALKNRDEIAISKKKEELAQWTLKFTKTQNRPSLNFTANAGYKNGYLPEIEKLTPNYFFGIGAKIPIFDANRTKINVKIQNSNLESIKFDSEYICRTIMNEVSENYSSLTLSEKKIEQIKLQIEQATEAYSLAEINYKLGTITNLDLLDAASMLAESKLSLLKANMDKQLNIIKLNISVGKRIY